MSETAHREFFGDAEHTFVLTPEVIGELEAKTGAGIGTLYGRLVSQNFRFADILEVIRLGLIGGGTDPKEAARLVDTYAARRPLAESVPLALTVLDRLWSGAPET